MNEEEKIDLLLDSVDEEYLDIVFEILNHPEFLKRKTYNHHEDSSVYLHSLQVSIKSYKIAKSLNLDYNSAAIAGLLHDFYYKDWHIKDKTKKGLRNLHGFKHAYEGFVNSRKYFPEYMNDIVEDSILKHMFPLNIRPPRYLEGWVITLSDKIVSLSVFKTPSKLYKYVGLSFIVNFFKKS